MPTERSVRKLLGWTFRPTLPEIRKCHWVDLVMRVTRLVFGASTPCIRSEIYRLSAYHAECFIRTVCDVMRSALGGRSPRYAECFMESNHSLCGRLCLHRFPFVATHCALVHCDLGRHCVFAVMRPDRDAVLQRCVVNGAGR